MILLGDDALQLCDFLIAYEYLLKNLVQQSLACRACNGEPPVSTTGLLVVVEQSVKFVEHSKL